MKRAIRLYTIDGEYEALYIDGNLIDEGEELGEGCNFTYLLRMSETYCFSYNDFTECELSEIDDSEVCMYGFPSSLIDLKGVYDLK